MVKKTRILQSGRRRERERVRELPSKWVKHKIKPQNTKIRYENTANTKGFMDGQTWRRLKRIIIVVFQNSFSKFVFVVCNVWYTWRFNWEDISFFDTKLWTCHFQGKSWLLSWVSIKRCRQKQPNEIPYFYLISRVLNFAKIMSHISRAFNFPIFRKR